MRALVKIKFSWIPKELASAETEVEISDVIHDNSGPRKFFYFDLKVQ